MSDLLPVDDALARILSTIPLLGSEPVPLSEALGRVLAEDLAAGRTQPPSDMSAMDGYAVRSADIASLPASLTVVGEAPAGGAYPGTLKAGEAVRIFTGGPVPEGADSIVIQEDTVRDGDRVTVTEMPVAGRHIRRKGFDFKEGQITLKSGIRLTSADISLSAAMNRAVLPLRRKPVIAYFSTGDELVLPGEEPGPNQIVSSNNAGLGALILEAGGTPLDLGIAPDRPDLIREIASKTVGCDMLVTLGGASVGDHDLVQSALAEDGLEVAFWRIAMRPGKPLMFGRYRGLPMLGLPGNPVSALVCAHLFLVPAISKFQGAQHVQRTEKMFLAKALPENDKRQDYVRARFVKHAEFGVAVEPFDRQDSSMLSQLSAADGLIVRPPFAPAAAKGETVPFLRLR